MPKDKERVLFYPSDLVSRKSRAYSGFVANTGDVMPIAKIQGRCFFFFPLNFLYLSPGAHQSPLPNQRNHLSNFLRSRCIIFLRCQHEFVNNFPPSHSESLENSLAVVPGKSFSTVLQQTGNVIGLKLVVWLDFLMNSLCDFFFNQPTLYFDGIYIHRKCFTFSEYFI